MGVEANIKEYLREEGLTQVGVSRKTGIPADQLSLTLNGKRKLTVDEFVRICDAIKKTPNDFVGYD